MIATTTSDANAIVRLARWQSGCRLGQIAETLFVSHRTVTSHVTHILGKLDLPSRTAAVSFAIRHGLA